MYYIQNLKSELLSTESDHDIFHFLTPILIGHLETALILLAEKGMSGSDKQAFVG